MKSQLIRSILSKPWMINPSSAEALAPMVVKLINGEAIDFGKRDAEFAKIDESGRAFPSFAAVPNSIAYIPVFDVITKYQNCNLHGTYDIAENIRQITLDPDVKGVIFELDTPGGEADYLDTLHDLILNCGKPVIAYYHGMCASAGYYIASAADEIYAQSAHDIVGSIGTMISFYDMSERLKQEGVKLVEVYADKSTAKNRFWRDVLAGKYDDLKNKILNPFNEDFLKAVQQKRTFDTSGVGKDVLAGETYTTADAIKIGMINGKMSFDQVVERMRVLINTKQSSNNSQNNTSMNKEFKAVASLIEVEGIEAHEGMVSLPVEQMEKIDAALVKGAADATALAEAQAKATEDNPELLQKIKDLETKNEELQTSVTAKDKEINTLNAKVDELSGSAGAEETTATQKDNEFEGDGEVEPWLDPENPMNQAAAQITGQK